MDASILASVIAVSAICGLVRMWLWLRYCRFVVKHATSQGQVLDLDNVIRAAHPRPTESANARRRPRIASERRISKDVRRQGQRRLSDRERVPKPARQSRRG